MTTAIPSAELTGEFLAIAREAVAAHTPLPVVTPSSPFDAIDPPLVRVGAMTDLTGDPRTGLVTGTALVVEYHLSDPDDPYGTKARTLTKALATGGSNAGRGLAGGSHPAGSVIKAHTGQVSTTTLQTSAGAVHATAYPLSLTILPTVPTLYQTSPRDAAMAVANAIERATVTRKVAATGSNGLGVKANLLGPKAIELVLNVTPLDSTRVAFPITPNEARAIASGAIEGLPRKAFASVGRIVTAKVASSEPFQGGTTRFTVHLAVEFVEAN